MLWIWKPNYLNFFPSKLVKIKLLLMKIEVTLFALFLASIFSKKNVHFSMLRWQSSCRGKCFWVTFFMKQKFIGLTDFYKFSIHKKLSLKSICLFKSLVTSTLINSIGRRALNLCGVQRKIQIKKFWIIMILYLKCIADNLIVLRPFFGQAKSKHFSSGIIYH